MEKAWVSNIQRFSVHDGPGVRTTVFFKGCPLNCKWCHNPETKTQHPQIQLSSYRCIECGACAQVCPNGCHIISNGAHAFDSTNCIVCGKCVAACLPKALELCGKEMTTDEILDIVLRDLPFYGNDGGLTISGGEPMFQPCAALELLRKARTAHISTCVETSGLFPTQYLQPLLEVCDSLLWDLKDTDPQRHLENVGVALEPILSNITLAAGIAPEKITIRCILVRGINDRQEHIDHIIAFAKSLGLRKVILFPFHPFGSGKIAALGQNAPVMGKEYIPDGALLASFQTQVDEALTKQ